MALSFSVKPVISKGLGGMKLRLIKITFDATYANGIGYTVTPTNCKLKSKILACSSAVIGVFTVSPVLSGNNVVLTCVKGAAGVNVECATNESGLNTLVGMFTVWGY